MNARGMVERDAEQVEQIANDLRRLASDYQGGPVGVVLEVAASSAVAAHERLERHLDNL